MIKTILIITLLSFNSLSESCQNEIRQEDKVIKTAKDNISGFLSKIPVGQENNYGFANREEFRICVVGKPYRVVTFTNDFYTDEKLSNKNYILIQNEWRVPITVNGENRLLFTVIQQDTIMQVVDIGGAALAKELEQNNADLTSKDSYLLRVYPLTLDFLVKVPQGSSFTDATFIPMKSARMILNSFDNKGLTNYALKDILQIIKQQINQQFK
jgi:hypothetical protein